MSENLQRDQASALAKTNPKKALQKACSVSEPWFRAQALSWVARFTDGDPVSIARQAAKAATECDDDYKRSAVRAWEIAALAERGFTSEAKKALNEAVKIARTVQPISSRCEAFFELFQAAFSVSHLEADKLSSIFADACSPSENWRYKRVNRDMVKMLGAELKPRKFYC